MGEEVKPSVIKKTQDSLGKFLKRPPLTEKLLKKPPFRFLHDIITAVIRQYGLMEGLFTAEDMISDNVKDKESKIIFLQKVIDTMKLLSGPTLTVRPSKIVAGQEAEKTNELLQSIAKALEKKLNSKKAVDQVLGKTKEGTSVAKTSNSTSKTKEQAAPEVTSVNGKPTTKRKDSKSSPEKKERSKAGSKERKPKEIKPLIVPEPIKNGTTVAFEASVPEPVSLGAAVEEEMTSFEPSAPDLTPDLAPSLPAPPEQEQEAPTELVEVVREEREEVEPVPLALEAVSTTPVLGSSSEQPLLPSPDTSVSGIISNDMTRAPTAVTSSPVPAPRPASTRPGSARPRPLTARPAAPRLKERVVRPAREDLPPEPATGTSTNIILDSAVAKQAEEDDETFVVEEAPPAPQELPEVLEPVAVGLPLDSDGGEQGHLVSQILGTQRELEMQQQADTKDQQAEWQWSGRDVARKEVGRLREAVQGLVRAANPLGRLLDFLQEDVESMQLELEQWQGDNQRLRADIAREKQITAESLQPLQKELAELNSQVEQQKQSISALKTVVIFNEQNLMDSLLSE